MERWTVDTSILVRLHRQLPAGHVPDILRDDRRTAQLLEHIALSQLMHPSNRSSCNCRTSSCYVAIPTLHDNRTDTIARFTLNRLQYVSPTQKTAMPVMYPLKECRVEPWPRWSIKSRRNSKFPHFEPAGRVPPAGKFPQAFLGGLKTPVVVTGAYRVINRLKMFFVFWDQLDVTMTR